MPSSDSGLKALMKKKNGPKIAYLIRYFILTKKKEGFALLLSSVLLFFEKNESQVIYNLRFGRGRRNG